MVVDGPCPQYTFIVSGKVNKLFLIDGDKVLHHHMGNCMDVGCGTTLYGEKINQRLAECCDSITGARINIYNESYRSMFETIIKNLDKSDLGLGPNHTVREVYF